MSPKHPEQKGVLTMITGGLILNLPAERGDSIVNHQGAPFITSAAEADTCKMQVKVLDQY